MVAYSFQKQFVAPIVSLRKAQTIRADRKRHARAGERLQLFTAMRTKQCRKIGEASCLFVREVELHLVKTGSVRVEGVDRVIHLPDGLDEFARSDGFASWEEMTGFWDVEHFKGFLIEWRDFAPAAEAA